LPPQKMFEVVFL